MMTDVDVVKTTLDGNPMGILPLDFKAKPEQNPAT